MCVATSWCFTWPSFTMHGHMNIKIAFLVLVFVQHDPNDRWIHMLQIRINYNK
jgi:hypothetical protein